MSTLEIEGFRLEIDEDFMPGLTDPLTEGWRQWRAEVLIGGEVWTVRVRDVAQDSPGYRRWNAWFVLEAPGERRCYSDGGGGTLEEAWGRATAPLRRAWLPATTGEVPT